MTQLKLIFVFALTFSIANWFTNLAGVSMYALVTVPGTFMHELMHWGAAMLTNGDPSGFSIIPAGNTLGHVMIRPNWYNATIISLAPLLLAPLTLLLIVIAARSDAYKMPLFAYFAACCFAACIPSSTDFSIAVSYPTSWLPGLILLSLISWVTFSYSFRLIKTH